MGIPPRGIARLETGGPAQVWELPLLAAALGVTTDELMGANCEASNDQSNGRRGIPATTVMITPARLRAAAITADLHQLERALERLALERLVLSDKEECGQHRPATARRTEICMTVTEVRRQSLMRERAALLGWILSNGGARS